MDTKQNSPCSLFHLSFALRVVACMTHSPIDVAGLVLVRSNSAVLNTSDGGISCECPPRHASAAASILGIESRRDLVSVALIAS
jgi:hypothetical protein